MTVSTEDAFASLRAKRTSDDGKACVDLAEKIYGSATEDASKEARQWVALGLACDKAEGDAELKKLGEQRKRKGETRGKARKLADMQRDNVVPMTGRGDAI